MVASLRPSLRGSGLRSRKASILANLDQFWEDDPRKENKEWRTRTS